MRSTRDSYTLLPARAMTLTARVLERQGASMETAAVQAQHLVEAELRGHPSHGLRRLPILVNRIAAGLIAPDAAPDFRWTAEATLAVDGALGFGPVSAYATLSELVAAVPRTGVAVAALRRTHHLGMLAPYVEELAARGCVGLVFSSTEALVHAWGGAEPVIGTNPIAIGIPTEGEPLVLDMSTGATSAGRILDHKERNKPIPQGWAVDARGRETTDPELALKGAISPFGGPKGYGFALALGSLVGLLTNTEFGTAVRGTLDASHATTKGDVILAIHAEAFGGVAESLSRYLALVRDSGVEGREVLVPGDRARACRSVAMQQGFEVTEAVMTYLLTAEESHE